MCSPKELKQITLSGASLMISVEKEIKQSDEEARKIIKETEKELRFILL